MDGARAAGGRLGELPALSPEPVGREPPISAGEQVVTVTVRGRRLYA